MKKIYLCSCVGGRSHKASDNPNLYYWEHVSICDCYRTKYRHQAAELLHAKWNKLYWDEFGCQINTQIKQITIFTYMKLKIKKHLLKNISKLKEPRVWI